MKWSRSVSRSMALSVLPVFSASSSFMVFRMRRICSAWIWISVAWPWAPPEGWWIMISAWGSALRLPFAPAASRNAPIEAAMPMHSVDTSHLRYFMVS